METETLSNYEQKHLDNTMDVDITNEDESVSPVNKTYEESTESTDIQDKAEIKGSENKNKNGNTSRIEVETDEEECDEEEDEKLMLSPAHSDKAYDSDEAPISPPLNRDLEESENEGDNEKVQKKLDATKSKSEPKKIESSDKSKEEDNVKEAVQVTEDGEEDKNKEDGDPLAAEDNESKQDKEDEEPLVSEDNDSKQDKVDGKKKDEDPLQDNAETSDDKVPNSDKDEDKNIDSGGNEEDKNEETKKMEEISDTKKSTDDSEENGKEEVKNGNEKEDTKDDNEEKEGVKDGNEKEDTKDDNEEKDGNEKEDSAKSGEKEVDKDDPEKENMIEDDNEENSLLKETLSKPFNDGRESEAYEEMDMDEEIDPSLLCPELSMEVDEAPVITTNDAPAPETDGSKSPLRLYDPIFSTFVDEMTGAEVDFNLTAEELDLKVKTYGHKNPIQFTKIHCTACNVHLGSALDGQGNRFVHPLLKVLICKKCYHFYTSGEFEKDEDGSELYCRWCGQGGQVMCCSNCEMVFCKKCIRINFDRRKLADIQKSDEWMCFRCNPSQLIHLRIHCAEFMEFVQSELRRAGSSGNMDAFMNTDYCQCCIPQKKKAADSATPGPSKKRKRMIGEEDPDYDPMKERDSPIPTPHASQQISTFTPRIVPGLPQPRPNIIRSINPVQARPRVQILTPPAIRPQQQGFMKIMPGGVRLTGPSTPNIVTATRPAAATAAFRPLRPNNAMKHEWFDKTVRAAARVNSNLSYTLTQLNRAQANASSVEGLAVVHNKLQEILSSSINSLIQIRKNLRTEFIAGIKNLRFPPKTTITVPSAPSTSKDDDDVIFVPSDPSPPPPPLVPVSNNSNSKITLPSSISLLKKSSFTATSTPGTSAVSIKSTTGTAVAKKSTSAAPDESNKPKGFLRVKSFSALQSVPSECITIPDDPPDDEVKKVEEKDPLDVSDVITNESVSLPAEHVDASVVNAHTNGMTNGEEKEEDETSNKDKDVAIQGDFGKLKPAKIVLHRSEEIDAMVKNQFNIVNGCDTD